MAENKTSQREKLVNRVLAGIIKNLEGDEPDKDMDNPTAKDVFGAFTSWGGKSKDEIVQVLCKEIGLATAAVLKEPLDQVLENRKLKITMELVPKNEAPPPPKKSPKKPKAKKKAKPRNKKS